MLRKYSPLLHCQRFPLFINVELPVTINGKTRLLYIKTKIDYTGNFAEGGLFEKANILALFDFDS